ncbi:TNFAIP3-interacting protein 1-like isoform X2 [Acropora millepora]|uniref:TNFAIP3-interacting protein 1-like isoform X2 n=1 Tax=Acropora millepora TaxID=45264 RepID=UPI001CF5F1B2|nr:TNFAIP3-interacting protein 1-like isoform X2 [Acropora millepora]
MSKVEDTPKPSLDEMFLQRQIQHLLQENKVLQIRTQGVQVLGKVLQESQENNARLEKEVEQLKLQLNQNGIDSSQVDFSVCTVSAVIDDECQQGSAASTLPNTSSNTSVINSNSGIHDHIHVTTASGPQSFSAGSPSLLIRENNVKETQAEFQLIGCEFDQLIKHIRCLRENFEKLPASNRDTETEGKLIVLWTKLTDYARQAKTRETLSSALVSEEEKIRAKLAEMEEEQASHEVFVQQLKEILEESREEIGEIQTEVNTYQEAAIVKREKEARVAHEQPKMIHSGQTTRFSPSQKGHGMGTSLQNTVQSGESYNQLQRQLAELQKQLLIVKAEKDEAIKLKEEVLDVNHKWDAQYKMLVAANGKEITDLKAQIKALSLTHSSGGSEEDSGEKKALEQRCRWLENELRQKQLEIHKMQRALSYKPGDMAHPPTGVGATGRPLHGPLSSSSDTHTPQEIPEEVIDQIEVLKQQLRVYADDFASEREDRERNQTEKEKLREELNVVKEQVQTLEQQAQIYQEDFKREKREKEVLQEQLRSYRDEGGLLYKNPVSQRVRLLPEQEARMQAIREVHDRERDRHLIGRKDAHMYGQQPEGAYATARRAVTQPIKQSSASSMYRGGEVQPDTAEDVIDTPVSFGNDTTTSNNDVTSENEKVQVEECPRCLRKFNDETNDTILKHIERCIS